MKLQFDYGLKTDYNKEVLHISPNFKKTVFHEIPELQKILFLFDQSQHGIAFKGQTKDEVGKRLKKLHLLSPFPQFLEVLYIFQLLASSEEFELLHNSPYITKYNEKQQQRLREVYSFVDQNYQQKISVDQVAALCHLEEAAMSGRHGRSGHRQTLP